MCFASIRLLSGNSGNTDPIATTAEDTVTENHKGHSRHHHGQQARNVVAPRSVLGTAAPYINLALISFLLMGAAMYFIAQFYGIEGLVQSAPDNGGKSKPLQHHASYPGCMWLADISQHTPMWDTWVVQLAIPTTSLGPKAKLSLFMLLLAGLRVCWPLGLQQARGVCRKLGVSSSLLF